MSFKSLTLASALFFPLAAAAPLWAHAYPMIVLPPDGAALRDSPREVRMQFTEGLEIEFSRIVVKNAAGEKVAQGSLRRLADDTVAVELKPLAPGAYTVEWQVLSVDTHVTNGVFHFTVGAGK